MSRDRVGALNAMKAAILAAAPARMVTRTLVDLDQHTDEQMTAGLYIIVFDGVRSYPYEHSDYTDGIDAPSQTELGNNEFIVIGRGRLAETPRAKTSRMPSSRCSASSKTSPTPRSATTSWWICNCFDPRAAGS